MPLLQQHYGRKRHTPTILTEKLRHHSQFAWNSTAGVNLSKTFFLTGYPGVGKTTVLTKIVDELKRRGFKVGGMISSEVREDNTRVGFKIVNLSNGTEGWLASIRHTGPKIGKYHVCLEDLESVGVKAIQNAVAEADVVVIDEVGPMELLSAAFRDVIVKALDCRKPVLGTIHHHVTQPLVTDIKKRTDVKIIEVTTSNRDELPALVTREISEVSEKT